MAPDRLSPTDTVVAFLRAMMAKDYEVGLTMVADGCEYTNIPMSTVEGPAGVRAVLEPFFAPTIRNEFVVRHQVEVGPVVFLERLDRHLLPKGWVELPVTGVFEVHDGKITLWRDYFDLATIIKEWPTA
ncbi:MAG: limonene-1,2-epoxide hydrolase family protein [Hyphomonadaceae bacterium]